MPQCQDAYSVNRPTCVPESEATGNSQILEVCRNCAGLVAQCDLNTDSVWLKHYLFLKYNYPARFAFEHYGIQFYNLFNGGGMGNVSANTFKRRRCYVIFSLHLNIWMRRRRGYSLLIIKNGGWSYPFIFFLVSVFTIPRRSCQLFRIQGRVTQY